MPKLPLWLLMSLLLLLFGFCFLLSIIMNPFEKLYKNNMHTEKYSYHSWIFMYLAFSISLLSLFFLMLYIRLMRTLSELVLSPFAATSLFLIVYFLSGTT